MKKQTIENIIFDLASFVGAALCITGIALEFGLHYVLIFSGLYVIWSVARIERSDK